MINNKDEIMSYDQFYQLKNNVETLINFYKYLASVSSQNKIPNDIQLILSKIENDLQNHNLRELHKQLTSIECLEIVIINYGDLKSQNIELIKNGIMQLLELKQLKMKLLPQDKDMIGVFNQISLLKLLEELSLDLYGYSNNMAYLYSLRNLQKLEISIKSEKYYEGQFYFLPIYFQNLGSLKYFKFLVNKLNIQDNIFKDFLDKLQVLNQLEYLEFDIKSSTLTISSLFELFLNIKFYKKLKQLFVNLQINQSSDHDQYLLLDNIFENSQNLMDVFLDFSYYEMKLSQISGIFKSMKKLSQLQSLSLVFDQNQIDDNTAKVIGSIFQGMQNLTNLYFSIGSQSYLTDEGMSSITEGFSFLGNLEYLKLVIYEGSKLNNKGWNQLFERITSIQSLIKLELYIYDTNFPILSFNILGQNLKSLSFLKRFELIFLHTSSQQVSLKSTELVYENFNSLKNLTDLSIQIPKNSTNLKGLNVLSNSLSSLSNLNNLLLVIQENNIQNQGADYLAQGLSKLMRLESLYLEIGYQNNVNDIGMKKLGESFCHLKQLSKLCFTVNSKNYLEREGALGLAEGLNQLTNLKKLSLFFYDIYLKTEHFKTVWKSFDSLKMLEELNLFIGYNNYVMVCELGIECGLKNLTNLKTFSLSVDSRNRYHYISYVQLIKALKDLPKLIDFSMIIQPINPQEVKEQVDSSLIYNEIKHLKGLQKLKLYTPFKQNLEILSLLEELPLIRQDSIDLQYFKSIEFEREFCFRQSEQQKSKIKKLSLQLLDDENNGRFFYDLQSIQNGLQNFTNLVYFKFYFLGFQGEKQNPFKGINFLKNLIELDFGCKMKESLSAKQIFFESFMNLQKLLKVRIHQPFQSDQTTTINLKQYLKRHLKRLVIASSGILF